MKLSSRRRFLGGAFLAALTGSAFANPGKTPAPPPAKSAPKKALDDYAKLGCDENLCSIGK